MQMTYEQRYSIIIAQLNYFLHFVLTRRQEASGIAEVFSSPTATPSPPRSSGGGGRKNPPPAVSRPPAAA